MWVIVAYFVEGPEEEPTGGSVWGVAKGEEVSCVVGRGRLTGIKMGIRGGF